MRLRSLAIVLLSIISVRGSAQSSITVSLSDPTYLDVDRLIGAGLVDTVIVGQRPYSRREMARIAMVARRALDATSSRATDALDRQSVQRLLSKFGADTASMVASGIHLFDAVQLNDLLTDAPTRPVPGNGTGSIEADVNPFTDNQHGRHLVTGENLAFESVHWLQLGPNLTISARPRIWAYRARDSATMSVQTDLLSANARLVVDNIAVTIGREYTEWSNAPGGGLFFSANAPSLDMIRVASDGPFRLPSALSVLGPVSATLQVADVGASANHSHSRLLSYKVSVQPSDGLELGATFDNHYGGAGAKNPSVLDRLFDFLPFVDIFRTHPDSTDFDSDKILGVDGRYRFARAANVTLFSEMAIEDFDVHRLRSIFTEEAAYIFGVQIPSLFLPSVSAQLSHHSTGIRFYEHHLLLDGITSSRFTLGDDLGHDAAGWYSTVTWSGNNGLGLVLDGAVEDRSNDTYVNFYTDPAHNMGFVFQHLAYLPHERMGRGVVGIRYFSPDGSIFGQLNAGVERTSNFGFVAAPVATHGLLSLSVAIYR